MIKAIESADYEAIASNYQQLSKLIEEKKKYILEQIESLPRQNMEENRQQFLNAYSTRLDTTLPQWYRLNSLINEQKITEGDIIDTGSKGDPIVKTPEGKTVIISGIKAEKGTRIKYKITSQGAKVDFGRFIDMNADFFYTLLNQDALGNIQSSFNSVDAYLKTGPEKFTPEVLRELLTNLETTREIANNLKLEEKERINGKVLAYRKILLTDYGIKLAIDFIAHKEENEIAELSNGDAQKLALALSSPGLFRRQTFQVLKNELFAGNKLRGYDEILSNMESNLDSMDVALKLMEFKTDVEELEPQVRAFLGKMDELFMRLNNKALNTIYAIAEDKVVNISEIQGKVENAFSELFLDAELKKVFRSPNEFFTLREALAKLRAALGNNNSLPSESAIKPYLKQKIKMAFERQQAIRNT